MPAGVNLPADVNADGVVNLLADLTAVAQGIDAAGGNLNGLSLQELEAALLAAVEHCGESQGAAAWVSPTHVGMSGQILSVPLTAKNIAAALVDVRQSDGRRCAYQKSSWQCFRRTSASCLQR